MFEFAIGFWLGVALAGYGGFQYGRRPEWVRAQLARLMDKVTGK